MSNAIEAIVGRYVKNGDLAVLERLRAHRMEVLNRFDDASSFNFDLVRNTCQCDIDAIDAGIEQILGDCRGHLDIYNKTRIAGWAQYLRHPARRVTIGIYINRKLIAEIVADHFRKDLADAGLGDGCHAYEFVPPEGSFQPPLELGIRHGRKSVIQKFEVHMG